MNLGQTDGVRGLFCNHQSEVTESFRGIRVDKNEVVGNLNLNTQAAGIALGDGQLLLQTVQTDGFRTAGSIHEA